MVRNAPANRRLLLLFFAAFSVFSFTYLFMVSPSLGQQDPRYASIPSSSNSNDNPNVEFDVTTYASDELLAGSVIMPELGNATARAELGHATWKVLHTVMARYPDEPTTDEQEALRTWLLLLGRLYPCGQCASHLRKFMQKYPPQVSSRSAAAAWACFLHNEVNKVLDKPQFDCSKIGDFYDCGCGDDGNEQRETAKASGELARKNPLQLETEPEGLTRGG